MYCRALSTKSSAGLSVTSFQKPTSSLIVSARDATKMRRSRSQRAGLRAGSKASLSPPVLVSGIRETVCSRCPVTSSAKPGIGMPPLSATSAKVFGFEDVSITSISTERGSGPADSVNLKPGTISCPRKRWRTSASVCNVGGLPLTSVTTNSPRSDRTFHRAPGSPRTSAERGFQRTELFPLLFVPTNRFTRPRPDI